MKRATLTSAGVTAIALTAILFAWQPWAHADADVQNGNDELTLITATPEEGFALALTLARKGVTETQPDREVLHGLRDQYANDPDSLTAASHVVAVHFQTVAKANEYWRQ